MEDFVVSAQSNERVGAYIIDSEGNAVPDLRDEAMAARQKTEVRNTKSEIRGKKSEIRNPKSEIKEQEVDKDA